jgi:phosphoadenosine phosphosulfate reductase
MRKVLPLQVHLDKIDAWITGMRRNQNDFRKDRNKIERYRFDELRDRFLFKINPMLEWTREDVWTYLRQHGIPWNPLHDRGFRSIGCWPCTRAVGEGEDDRAGRWEGFEKSECGIHTFLGQSI